MEEKNESMFGGEIVRIENTTNFDTNAMTEFSKTILKPIFLRFGVVMPICFLILAGLGFFFLGFNLVMTISVAVIGVACGIASPFLYKTSMKTSMKNNKVFSSNTFLDYKFTDGGIIVRTLKGSVEIASNSVDYRWIEKVIPHSHYLYIFISSSACYIFDTLGMTKGKSKDVVELFLKHNIKFVNKQGKKMEESKISLLDLDEKVKNAKFESVSEDEKVKEGEIQKENMKNAPKKLQGDGKFEGDEVQKKSVGSVPKKFQGDENFEGGEVKNTGVEDVHNKSERNGSLEVEKFQNKGVEHAPKKFQVNDDFEKNEVQKETLEAGQNKPKIEKIVVKGNSELTEAEKKRKNALDKMTK